MRASLVFGLKPAAGAPRAVFAKRNNGRRSRSGSRLVHQCYDAPTLREFTSIPAVTILADPCSSKGRALAPCIPLLFLQLVPVGSCHPTRDDVESGAVEDPCGTGAGIVPIRVVGERLGDSRKVEMNSVLEQGSPRGRGRGSSTGCTETRKWSKGTSEAGGRADPGPNLSNESKGLWTWA